MRTGNTLITANFPKQENLLLTTASNLTSPKNKSPHLTSSKTKAENGNIRGWAETRQARPERTRPVDKFYYRYVMKTKTNQHQENNHPANVYFDSFPSSYDSAYSSGRACLCVGPRVQFVLSVGKLFFPFYDRWPSPKLRTRRRSFTAFAVRQLN